MREIIEQMSIAAKDRSMDQQSGVSAPIQHRQLSGHGSQRLSNAGAVLGGRPAVPRVSDLGHLFVVSASWKWT